MFGHKVLDGNSAFGSTGFGKVITNTDLKFHPTVGNDTMMRNGVSTTVNTRYQCITLMKEYEDKSLEELRAEDYLAKLKGPQGEALSTFGQTTSDSTSFDNIKNGSSSWENSSSSCDSDIKEYRFLVDFSTFLNNYAFRKSSPSVVEQRAQEAEISDEDYPIPNSTFFVLKDLLKCKGGLPFCNSVWRHIELKSKLNIRLERFLDTLLNDSNKKKASSVDFDELENEDFHPNEMMELLLQINANDGYCEESDCIELDILEKPFMPDLENAGLKSLGKKIYENIRRLLATLSVLIYFAYWMLDEIIEEELSGENEFEKVDSLAKAIAREIVESFPESKVILKALKFVTKTEKNYPLMYHSLGIRTNWEVFILNHLKVDTFAS